ncbi:MAG: hypothetical protein ACXVEE_34985, partial [Polyangiales bacterium]
HANAPTSGLATRDGRGAAMRRPLALGILSPLMFLACLDRPVVNIEPSNTKVTIETLSVHKVEKVDLLLVVDGSLSMADKQSELGKRIPELISALTTPNVDPKTGKTNRVFDVHVGVISTNLGANGTGFCDGAGAHADDKAWLLPRPGDATSTGYRLDDKGAPVAEPCPEPKPNEPITWVTDSARDPSARFVGDEGAKQLQIASSCAVTAVKSDGCGVEATWEAVYRFLVDPSPYDKIQVSGNLIVTSGVDTKLLEQRKKFLRQDSLLAVVVLSDENDSSFKQTGDLWHPWASFTDGSMYHGAAGCAGVPDDFEPDDALGLQTLRNTYSCAPCDAKDPACPKWSPSDPDYRNLRSFHQIQRYGRNFLWSPSRYVDAFKVAKPKRPDGSTFVNPIFAGGQRTQDLVIVAGIVGVPEFLVADAKGPKKLGPDDWKKISSPILSERDPHMIESILPRPGLAKYAGNPSIDPVHGGERETNGQDLQYACIGPRSSASGGEDCKNSPGAPDWSTNPICKSETEQTSFKAYPGLRHLRILEGLGASGYVASICAESYSPAVKGITDRIRQAVDQQCVQSDLKPNETGNVDCMILEALASDSFEGKTRCEDLGKGYCTPGSETCRSGSSLLSPVSPDIAAAQLSSGLELMTVDKDGYARKARAQMTVEDGNVYAVAADGKKHLVCEMLQLAGEKVPAADATGCRTSTDPKWTPSVGGGWCYVQDNACASSSDPGRMRFVGEVEPKSGSQIYTMCVGH